MATSPEQPGEAASVSESQEPASPPFTITVTVKVRLQRRRPETQVYWSTDKDPF
jgi:hypothetical protein